MAPMAGGDTGGYVDMKAAAQMLESGNTGPLTAYAADAKAFANSLRARAESFSLGGVTWDGSSAEAAGEALLQHHDWLIKVAEQYDGLAAEAEEFVSDHRHAVSTHPKLDEIEAVEQEMDNAAKRRPPDRIGLGIAQDKYHELFTRSEEALVTYSAAVTGKGFLRVEKPPPGAAKVGPVSTNGDPRKPDPQTPQKPGSPQSPPTSGPSVPQQPPTGTPPVAEPMSSPAASQMAQQAPAGTTPPRVAAPPQEAAHRPAAEHLRGAACPADCPAASLVTCRSCRPTPASSRRRPTEAAQVEPLPEVVEPEVVEPAAVHRRRRCSRR